MEDNPDNEVTIITNLQTIPILTTEIMNENMILVLNF
jgi:hypothetical protein